MVPLAGAVAAVAHQYIAKERQMIDMSADRLPASPGMPVSDKAFVLIGLLADLAEQASPEELGYIAHSCSQLTIDLACQAASAAPPCGASRPS